MPDDAAALAERLLDAHVAHVVAELTGDGAAELVEEQLRAAIAVVGEVRVGDLVAGDDVAATVAAVLDAAGDADVVREMVATVARRLHGLPASDEHRLGDVVDRGSVEAIVTLLAGSEQLHEEVLHRLGRSPAVSTLAMRFVSALVGDAVQQNRERVEKVPGAKLALGMGDFAAKRARGLAPKQLEKVVGGAADRGAQAAMERVSRALVDTLDAAAVTTAVMEVWDLHAEDTVAGLRAYVSAQDVEQLAGDGHSIWLVLRTAPWFAAVVDTIVEGFLERHADQTVAAFLEELGVTDDLVVAEVTRHAPRVLTALSEDGRLDALVRQQLEGFYRSPAALAVLTEVT